MKITLTFCFWVKWWHISGRHQLGGGNSNTVYFHPEPWGKIFTHFDGCIFFKGVGSNHQLVVFDMFFCWDSLWQTPGVKDRCRCHMTWGTSSTLWKPWDSLRFSLRIVGSPSTDWSPYWVFSQFSSSKFYFHKNIFRTGWIMSLFFWWLQHMDRNGHLGDAMEIHGSNSRAQCRTCCRFAWMQLIMSSGSPGMLFFWFDFFFSQR